MTISLQALEAALSSIEEIGNDELTFDVGSTTITMRTLLPEEEQEVQRYASEVWSEDDGQSNTEALSYVSRFRVDTIARALVSVGDQDLTDVEYIHTGEVLANGKAVKEPRHQAVRKLVLKWGGPIRMAVFKKYAELLKKVEARGESSIQFEPSDPQAEIDRLEQRIAELRKELEEEKASGGPSPVHAVAAYGEMDKSDRAEALRKHQDLQNPPEPPAPLEEAPPEKAASAVPQARQPISPRKGSPPPPVSTPPPVSAPPPAEGGMPPALDSGSFIAPDDASAVAEANQRLFASRRKAQPGQSIHPEAESVLAEVKQTEFLGRTPEGTEVYALPPEEVVLDPSGGRGAPPPKPPKPDQTRNPRFRSSKP